MKTSTSPTSSEAIFRQETNMKNMEEIKKISIQARQEKDTSYGKYVGQEYAKKHVRVQKRDDQIYMTYAERMRLAQRQII